MYDLPSQLPDDAVQALRNNLQSVMELRDKIKALTSVSCSYRLSDYVSQTRERITGTNHGQRDRFYTPQTDAQMQLQALLDEGNPKLNAQFSKHKTTLLSILNKYLKGMQRGFREHKAEIESVPPA